MSAAHTLTPAQLDRAAGVLLASACGDALGAPYEFGPPLPPDKPVGMIGGGGYCWEPGEWTDDTSMAIPIAEVAAEGLDLRSPEAQNRIARRWVAWSMQAKDVGIQTSQVLGRAGPDCTGKSMTRIAADLHAILGRSGGNGSLMRTAPVALAYLNDPSGLSDAARQISAMTHHDPEAGEACAIWCEAIRHAVLEGTFDGLRPAVDDLPRRRRKVWHQRVDEAEANPPEHFSKNSWVVQALQGAWSAISRTAVPDDEPANGTFAAQHLQLSLEAAVRGGRDTDTVAAIAGGLLGARWGASALPGQWTGILHGWPGFESEHLLEFASAQLKAGSISDYR